MANLVIKNKNTTKNTTPETYITLENITSNNADQKIGLSNYNNTFKIKIEDANNNFIDSIFW